MESVSWNEAMEFCNKLTARLHRNPKMSGWKFTLPTEKQWEYFVEDATLAQAVYGRSDNSGTLPVGSRGANKLGVYDVRGNVWEWCRDWYDSSQQYKVLRGASWSDLIPENLAVSYRR
ncbi:MAG: formylglycine-generating enzyme family protein [Blastochloris sp.]|nr:formylglycine-generating enzyme family protein [Blastochloris sp.]